MKQLIAFVILISFVFPAAPARAEDKLKFGVIAAFSGEGAPWGEACRNGITLALKGLPPGAADKIEIVYEDDANASKNTVTAFNKLVTTDKVDVVMTWSSGTSNAVAPLADARKVPLIAIASDPKIVEGRKFAVNLWVTPDAEGAELSREFARRSITNIARITSLQEGMIAIRSGFDKANAGKVTVQLDEEYAADAKDFRPFLLKLKTKSDVQAIYVNLYVGQVGVFAKQARELGITLPMVGVETFEDDTQVKLSGGALVGQWYIQAGDPSDAYLAQYAAAYPNASNVTSANCHDAVVLLSNAIESGNRATLNDFLHRTKDVRGALGSFSATGSNTFTLPATVKVVTEKGFQTLKAEPQS